MLYPRALMRVILLGAALLSVACSSKDPAATSASARASAAPPPPPASAAPARPPADDLDPEPLKKALKCAAGAKTGPCKVLEAVASCGPWDAAPPSGDGRWLGRSWEVRDGKHAERYVLVRSRAVPQSEVPGGLTAKIAVEIVPEDLPSLLGVKKAIAAYERHDVPQKGNAGVAWAKEKKDFSEDIAFATAKKHVVVQSTDPAFLCLGATQTLYLVRPKGTGKNLGDGLYAELWAINW